MTLASFPQGLYFKLWNQEMMIGTVGLLVRDQRILVSNTYFIENLRENRL